MCIDQEKEEPPSVRLWNQQKVFRAKFLDQGAQPLAFGETLPVDDCDEFRFLPDNPQSLPQASPRVPTFLETLRGETFRLVDLRSCGCKTYPEHYLFRLAPFSF
jgi:hypothetical protein